jgi:hypothetical protein
MQNRAGFTNPASESIANYGTRSKIEFYQYFTYIYLHFTYLRYI